MFLAESREGEIRHYLLLLKALTVKPQRAAILHDRPDKTLRDPIGQFGLDFEGHFHLCPIEAGQVLHHFLHDHACICGQHAFIPVHLTRCSRQAGAALSREATLIELTRSLWLMGVDPGLTEGRGPVPFLVGQEHGHILDGRRISLLGGFLCPRD